MRRAFALLIGLAAGCSSPMSVEQTTSHLLESAVYADGNVLRVAVCGWPVAVDLHAEHVDLTRAAAATDEEGRATFAVGVQAPAMPAVTCEGHGSFHYVRRASSPSHGLRGRDYYQIDAVDRTDGIPGFVEARGREAASWSVGEPHAIALDRRDVVPDRQPAAIVRFDVATAGRYRLTAHSAIVRAAAYQRGRLLVEGQGGSLLDWDLAAGSLILVVVAATAPATVDLRLDPIQ